MFTFTLCVFLCKPAKFIQNTQIKDTSTLFYILVSKIDTFFKSETHQLCNITRILLVVVKKDHCHTYVTYSKHINTTIEKDKKCICIAFMDKININTNL